MGQGTSRRHTAAGQVSPYADKHNERLLSTHCRPSEQRPFLNALRRISIGGP